MFQNFQAWKLHSFEDYLTFLIIILAGIMIFKFAIQKIYKHRNDAYALKLVRKKLKYSRQGTRVFHNVTLSFGGQPLHYDHLLIDAAGIVAIRSIGWGIRIYGQPDQPTWKAMDNKTEKMIENPVAKLTDSFELLRSGLAAKEIYGLSIEPLVIFADPFATPELYLGRGSCCIPFNELKNWKKQRQLRAENKSQKLDVNQIASVIEGAIQ